jgi:hypothetical protein
MNACSTSGLRSTDPAQNYNGRENLLGAKVDVPSGVKLRQNWIKTS